LICRIYNDKNHIKTYELEKSYRIKLIYYKLAALKVENLNDMYELKPVFYFGFASILKEVY